MVGVLIQTMPMLLFSVHRHFVLVGGGCTRCPSRVSSLVASEERTHAEHSARVTALEGALTRYLCPSHACVHGTRRECFLSPPLSDVF